MTTSKLPPSSTGTSSPSSLGDLDAGAAGRSTDGFDWTDSIGPSAQDIKRENEAEALRRCQKRAEESKAKHQTETTPEDAQEQAASELSVDSERALLGAILFDADATWGAIDSHGISAPDFYDHKHQSIFKAVTSLRKRGRPVDLLTVTDYLKAKNELDRIGGSIALNRIVDDCPTSTHAGYYAGLVSSHAQRRRLASLANHWAEQASRGTPGPELLEQIKKGIEQLESTQPSEGCQAFSLVELAEQTMDSQEVILGTSSCRYIERGAVLFLVAPAGTGKSHFAAQGAVNWSCGRTAFGLPTMNGPLRVLILQAENPWNDARGMARSMLNGLDLTAEERALVAVNTRQLWLPGTTGENFLRTLDLELRHWPADLVLIDPLAGFAAGDLVKPEVVQAFCRAGLGRIAVSHKVALFVLHHIPKPNANRDQSRMGVFDHQYTGAGSADLVANWPRAVLTLQPLAKRGEFILRAAKRRPPWTTAGEQAWELGVRHTCWNTWETFQLDPVSIKTAGRPSAPDPETHRAAVLALVEKVGPKPKTALEELVRQQVTGSRPQARAILSTLLCDLSLQTWRGSGRGGVYMVGTASQRPAVEDIAE